MKFLVLLALSLCQNSLSFAPISSFASSTSTSSSPQSSTLHRSSSNSYNRNEHYQIINDNDNNSGSDSDNVDLGEKANTKDVIDRRSAIGTTTGIITSSILLSQIRPEQASADDTPTPTPTPNTTARKGPPLDVLVNKIEKGKYFGPDVIKMKNKEPQFVPNSNGAPEKHIPQIVFDTSSSGNGSGSGSDNISSGSTLVEMSANHVMKEEHYIQFMWLRDVALDEVVLVKALTSDEERPVLKARVPNGVTLVPCLYCNLHGLWKGEAFTVA